MSEKKFSWGTGILIVIIIFMVLTITTVVFLMNQKVDLVTDNYYAKEIKYQQQIDKMNRTNEFGDEIKIIADANAVRLIFPVVLTQKKIDGTVHFYRPSDSARDFILPLSIDTTNQQIIPVNNLARGYWKVKIDWTQDEVEYYKETSLIIN